MQLLNPSTGDAADFPDAVVPFWRAAGWKPVTPSRRTGPAPTNVPTDLGGDTDGSTSSRSTTEQSKE